MFLPRTEALQFMLGLTRELDRIAPDLRVVERGAAARSTSGPEIDFRCEASGAARPDHAVAEKTAG